MNYYPYQHRGLALTAKSADLLWEVERQRFVELARWFEQIRERSMRTIVTYDEIRAHRVQWGRCPVCNRRARRSHTEYMTVSPFNRNPDGSIRSPAEVHAAVEAKADEWVPDFRHEACVGAAQ